MNLLLNVLKVAVITHKTIAAIGASIVITVGVYEHLRKRKKKCD
jgi:ADP-ribosylglycohydrolase